MEVDVTNFDYMYGVKTEREKKGQGKNYNTNKKYNTYRHTEHITLREVENYSRCQPLHYPRTFNTARHSAVHICMLHQHQKCNFH